MFDAVKPLAVFRCDAFDRPRRASWRGACCHAECQRCASAVAGAKGHRDRSSHCRRCCEVHDQSRTSLGTNRLGRPQRQWPNAAAIRRHEQRQRRRPVVLLLERRRGLSRHRPELQRQGRPVPLDEYRRHTLGARHERRRQDRHLETNLGRRSEFRIGASHRRSRCCTLRAAHHRRRRTQLTRPR